MAKGKGRIRFCCPVARRASARRAPQPPPGLSFDRSAGTVAGNAKDRAGPRSFLHADAGGIWWSLGESTPDLYNAIVALSQLS